MVNAIARTIPTVNTNLAGFDFGAMYPSWRQIDVAMPDVRGANWKRCVSYFTLRIIIILMETIKDLYKRLIDHRPSPPSGGLPVCTGPDFKKKEKNPRNRISSDLSLSASLDLPRRSKPAQTV
jgi:hypothetical protein